MLFSWLSRWLRPKSRPSLDMLVGLRSAQERDPFVPEAEEVLYRQADSAIVLGLEPRERSIRGRTSGDHHRYRRLRQKPEARIVELGIGEQKSVDSPAG